MPTTPAKVLLVSDYPLGHPAGGGCEVMVDLTARLLDARGIATRLFTIDDVPDARRTARTYISHARAASALR
ncbi:MAG: hypothetical protein KDA25_03995, partial [Phycisphaerales bacterium]|nr:hypothetical protein [Phycisphaerales bacterium]